MVLTSTTSTPNSIYICKTDTLAFGSEVKKGKKITWLFSQDLFSLTFSLVKCLFFFFFLDILLHCKGPPLKSNVNDQKKSQNTESKVQYSIENNKAKKQN